MNDTATLDENARHLMFLTAAWIANVDGREDPLEVDALCQLRAALDIAPSLARKLLQLARSSCGPAPSLIRAM
ncbi:MAG: hypothetical protein AAF500_12925 [Myxococcota bacterium]